MAHRALPKGTLESLERRATRGRSPGLLESAQEARLGGEASPRGLRVIRRAGRASPPVAADGSLALESAAWKPVGRDTSEPVIGRVTEWWEATEVFS